MMKRALIIVVLSIVSIPVFSQARELSKDSPFKERIFFGGGLDLAFDSRRILVGASPSMGYMVTSTTSVGVGITYQIFQDRINNISTDIYGYRFFAMQQLIAQLFAYAEFENLSYETDVFIDNSDRYWSNAVYLGGGWFQPISQRTGFLVLGLYNLTQRNLPAGASPWVFRAGLTFSPF